MLYFNLDFTATIEKRHINKAKLSYKPSNDSAEMAVYFITSLESWLAAFPENELCMQILLSIEVIVQ